PPDAGSVDVELISEAGKVMVKNKGEARFNPAKKSQPVAAGAAFQVPPNARARVLGDGFSVRLPQGNGTVTSTGASEDGTEVGLDVNGSAQVALDGKAPAAVTFAGKTPLKLRGKKEAAVIAAKNRVEVVVGEVELVVNGKPQALKAGDV